MQPTAFIKRFDCAPNSTPLAPGYFVMPRFGLAIQANSPTPPLTVIRQVPEIAQENTLTQRQEGTKILHITPIEGSNSSWAAQS